MVRCFLVCLTFFTVVNAKNTLDFINPHVSYLNGAANLAAYMTIKNTGPQAIKLVSATCKMCKKTELHEHVIKNNIAHMQKVAEINIPAHSEAILQRGGDHIMLMGIVRALCHHAVANEKVVITLNFDDGSSHDVDFKLVWFNKNA